MMSNLGFGFYGLYGAKPRGHTPPEILQALKPYVYQWAKREGDLTEFRGVPPSLFLSLARKYPAFMNTRQTASFDSGATMIQIINLAARHRGTVSGAVAQPEFRDDGPFMYVDSIELPVSRSTAEQLKTKYGADELHKFKRNFGLWWD